MSLWCGLCYRIRGWKGAFEQCCIARLSSRPLWWMTGSSCIKSMNFSLCGKADLKWPTPRRVFAVEALRCPWTTSVSDVERRWIACRWSNLMQPPTCREVTGAFFEIVITIYTEPLPKCVIARLFWTGNMICCLVVYCDLSLYLLC